MKTSFWARKNTTPGGKRIKPGGFGSAVVAGKGQVNMLLKYGWRALVAPTLWALVVMFAFAHIKEIAALIF